MGTAVTSADLCHRLRQSLAGLVEKAIIVRGKRCEIGENDVKCSGRLKLLQFT